MSDLCLQPHLSRGSGHLFFESVVLRRPDWASSVLSSRLLVLGLWSPLVGGFKFSFLISHFKNSLPGSPGRLRQLSVRLLI